MLFRSVLSQRVGAQLGEIRARVKTNAPPEMRPISMPETEWQSRAMAHRARVAPQAEAFVQRRACGGKHPVWDFLFTYYSFSPAKLMTWVPAVSECGMSNAECRTKQEESADAPFDIRHSAFGIYEAPPMPARIRHEASWIARLCANVMSKPPRLTCHGLHEWAMVYRQSADQVRHSGYELRLPPDELAAFVESQSICCTHHDAYRFFTEAARPLNTLKPRLETRQEMEQSGCLHANMDLYKWAYKLWPWIGSDIVADAFEVAVAAREFDMRASPYDLAVLGFAPIKIETEEGREEYRREQLRIMELARPVRERLRNECVALLEILH